MPTIHPPSVMERVLRGLGYSLIGIAGTVVMLSPPDRIGTALGSMALLGIWAVFMLTGIPAAVAAILGRYRAEYMLLPFFTAGVAIMDGAIWIRAFSEDDSSLIVRALLVAALVFVYCARFVTLRRLVRIGLTLHRRGKFWGRI